MAVTPPPPTPIASLSVSLNPSSVLVGQTAQATATLQDSAGKPVVGPTITWESSDATVATVDATGLVRAVKAGNSMIKASSSGKTNGSSLTVSVPAPVPVATIAVSPTSATLQIGATQQLSAVTRDANNNVLTGRAISWSSANPAIATVSQSGLVTTVSAGSVSVSASSEGQVGSSAITVNPPAPVPVASVSVSPSSATLQIGATQQLTAVTRDANNNVLTGRSVSWSSANSSIASVNSASGLVTAVAAGTVQISATSEGKVASSSITVSPPAPVPVASVSVSPSSATVTVGGTQQLSAVTRDANNNVLSGRVVTWSSANGGIATVNSTGLVTAVAAGTVQITATSETKTGTSTITVQAPQLPPPPPPPGSSNEPTGMTLITQRSFSALQEGGWDTDAVLSIVQDPTAPKSPSSVLRATFPTGFSGGSSNGHTGVQFSGKRVLYATYWMKYSSNWTGHNTGINKQAYAWVTDGGGYTPFVMEAEGSGTQPLKPRPILQRMIKGDGNYEPNLVPNATIPRGKWFQIEIVLTGNSAGTANGSMDIYLDGVHVTSVGGLQWTTGATAWNIFELYPVWGGIGDTVPATMTADWDHVYLSGKN